MVAIWRNHNKTWLLKKKSPKYMSFCKWNKKKTKKNQFDRFDVSKNQQELTSPADTKALRAQVNSFVLGKIEFVITSLGSRRSTEIVKNIHRFFYCFALIWINYFIFDNKIVTMTQFFSSASCFIFSNKNMKKTSEVLMDRR